MCLPGQNGQKWENNNNTQNRMFGDPPPPLLTSSSTTWNPSPYKTQLKEQIVHVWLRNLIEQIKGVRRRWAVGRTRQRITLSSQVTFHRQSIISQSEAIGKPLAPEKLFPIPEVSKYLSNKLTHRSNSWCAPSSPTFTTAAEREVHPNI